jgi:hypothetical protein
MLGRNGSKWQIIHYERGIPTLLGEHDDEDSASEEFYKRLLKDFSWKQ